MTDASSARVASDKASTGVPGLDHVLLGGLPATRLHLLEGAPGAGKTTLALQFLLAGIAAGERCLYVTLSETADELMGVAASHGWTLDGMDLFELATAAQALAPDREVTLLHPWEVELGETVGLVTAEVERTRPVRVVLDSLSELRLLAQDPLRYRRQMLGLKQFFAARNCTVLLLDDRTGKTRDLQLHSFCHGVISLERLTLDFGAARRRLEVAKMRGVAFREGWHDFVIRTGGLEVFPRLVAAEHSQTKLGARLRSNVAGLDDLLGGGPCRGTSVLISGPAGCGKTTFSTAYVLAAAERGERAAFYEFDERAETLLARAAMLGMDLRPHVDAGRVVIRQVDPAELSPGELNAMIRREVEEHGTRVLVIDSLAGYLAAMTQEQHLLLQMHELLSYLGDREVTTFLLNPQHGLIGAQGTVDVSYVADTVVLLRFFEAAGRVRKAVSVLKSRVGGHEDTIREVRVRADGLAVGEPLVEFQGVLTGNPAYFGGAGPLLGREADGNAGG